MRFASTSVSASVMQPGQLGNLDRIASRLEIRGKDRAVAAALHSHTDLACCAELGNVGAKVLLDRFNIDRDDDLAFGRRLDHLRGASHPSEHAVSVADEPERTEWPIL